VKENSSTSKVVVNNLEHIKFFIVGRGLLAPPPNPQAGVPPPLGCPQLLIQYIRSYSICVDRLLYGHTQNKISIKFNSKLSKLAETEYAKVDLSHLHCSIYIFDKIINKWQKEDITGKPLSKNR
jgi:hypothetical protein